MSDLSSLTAALGVLKTVVDLAKGANNLELRQKLIDLQEALLNVRQELCDLQDQNDGLRQRLRQLTEANELETALCLEQGAYWISKSGEAERGPFCPICWDVNAKLVHFRRVLGTTEAGVKLECLEHPFPVQASAPIQRVIHLGPPQIKKS